MRFARMPCPFRELLEALRAEAARTLWDKAILASRCAKGALNPRSAVLAYRVKDRAMSRAIELAPDEVRVDNGPDLGLVGVRFFGRAGLHVPVSRLSPQAAAIVMSKIGLKPVFAEAQLCDLDVTRKTRAEA